MQIKGWLRPARILPKIAFFEVINGSTTYCVVDNKQLIQKLSCIPLESIISVSGIQQPSQSKKSSTELLVTAIDVINESKELPFDPRVIKNDSEIVNRQVLRYVHLRHDSMQHNLRTRSKILFELRNVMASEEFVEIETPTLFKPTSEGAKEFLIPVENDLYYALTQSPQQFKQMLMVGGFQKYFQIARCYRNENHRRDRQPEFTQLDVEASFSSELVFIQLTKKLLKAAFKAADLTLDDLIIMSYKDALINYGSDKPDLRLPYKLTIHDDFHLLQIPKQDLINIPELLITAAQFNLQSIENDNSIVFKQPLQELHHNPSEIDLGRFLRSEIPRYLRNPLSGYKPIWVNDFPLYRKAIEGIKCCHHPFTLPKGDLESTDIYSIIGNCYDLVINGEEIASGSIRIYDSKLQLQVFRQLKMTADQINQFSHLLNGLRSGCPPHGGIAYGIDRLIAILCSTKSIKDVIAFPKASNGKDLCFNSPNTK